MSRPATSISAARLTVIASGRRIPGRYSSFSRERRELLGLLGGAAAELDLDAAAGEQDRDRRAPAAGADHRRLAHRRQPAEPLPLQLDAGPDPARHGRRQRGRGVLGLREGDGLAGAQPDLARADLPAAADVLGAEHGDRQDRGAGLEREPADAAVRAPRASRGGSGCPRGRCRGRRRARGSRPRSSATRRRPGRGAPGRRRAGSGSSPARASRRARPWRRSASAAARAAARRSRTGRGRSGGWRRRSGRGRPSRTRGRSGRAGTRSGRRG